VSRSKRKLWLRTCLQKQELDRLLKILFDLVPSKYALQMVHGCGNPPTSRCRVVALQLDISGFTKLSQELSPDQVARTLNSLFTAFDDAVMGQNLFKVDTIGDAYVVVGFILDEWDSFSFRDSFLAANRFLVQDLCPHARRHKHRRSHLNARTVALAWAHTAWQVC
jgi:class 3 adenylate cyclase